MDRKPNTNSTIQSQLFEYRIIRIIRCNSVSYKFKELQFNSVQSLGMIVWQRGNLTTFIILFQRIKAKPDLLPWIFQLNSKQVRCRFWLFPQFYRLVQHLFNCLLYDVLIRTTQFYFVLNFTHNYYFRKLPDWRKYYSS